MSAEPTAAGGAAARVERVASELAELELDALMVDSLLDVRYLTGFTGSSGLVIAFAEPAARDPAGPRFLTDFRYEAQAARQVPGVFVREIVSGDLNEAVAALLAGSGGKLGFDEARVSVKAHRRLQEALPEGWEAVPCAGVVERLREVKDEGEIASIRAASELADAALLGVLEDGLVGRAERDVAIELELRMRRLGAQAPSFPSIVASGAHGALPHAEPRAQEIARDVLVTIDWGAQLEGYCSDCTRTYATGEGVSELAREIYALVLSAQRESLLGVRAGVSGRDVDAIARDLITAGGYGENFGHGLGHGVGLEVHEAPRLSRTAPEDPLRAGSIVTVEPGIYLPGELGVRIEDLVVVREGAQEVLTSLPKELTVLS